MPLIWGWGPFSIRPDGQQVALGDRVRSVFRTHSESLQSGSTEDFLSACNEMTSAVRQLWNSVADRVQSQTELQLPRGAVLQEVASAGPGASLVELKEIPLVRDLIEASLVASLLGIEYEMTSAMISPAQFPTDVGGPGFWEVHGQASETATHHSMPGIGFSEKFDPASRNATEGAFIIAATRAYVDAVTGIAPFRSGDGRDGDVNPEAAAE